MEQKKRTFFNSANFIAKLVEYLVFIVEVFLLLRFALKLFGANPGAPFVAWMYATTDPLLAPFRGIFPSPVIEQGFVFEFSTLFAMVIYAIIAWIIGDLIMLFARYVDRQSRNA